MGNVSTVRSDISSLVASLTRADAILAKKGGSAQLRITEQGRSIQVAGPATPETRALNEKCRRALFESMVKSDSLSDAALSNVFKALFGVSGSDYERLSGKPLSARTLKMIDLGIVMSEQGKQEEFSDFLSTVWNFADSLAKNFAEKFTANVYGTIYERLENDFVDVAMDLVKKRGVDVISDSSRFVNMVKDRVCAKNASFIEALTKAAAIMPKQGVSPDLQQAVKRTGLPEVNQKALMVRYESMIRESLARQIVRDGGIDSPRRALLKAETEVIKFNNLLTTSVKTLEKELVGLMDALHESPKNALLNKFVNDLQEKVTKAYEKPGFDESGLDRMLRGFQADKGVLEVYKEQAKLVAKCYTDACTRLCRETQKDEGTIIRMVCKELCDKIVTEDGLSCKADKLTDSVKIAVSGAFGSEIKNRVRFSKLKQDAKSVVDSVVGKLACFARAPLLTEKLVKWVEDYYGWRLNELGKDEMYPEEGEKKLAVRALSMAYAKLLTDAQNLYARREGVIDSLMLSNDDSLRKRIGDEFDEMFVRQLSLSDEEALSRKFNGDDVGSVENLVQCFKDALEDEFRKDILQSELDDVRESVLLKRKSKDDYGRSRFAQVEVREGPDSERKAKDDYYRSSVAKAEDRRWSGSERKVKGDYDKSGIAKMGARLLLGRELEVEKARRNSILQACDRDIALLEEKAGLENLGANEKTTILNALAELKKRREQWTGTANKEKPVPPPSDAEVISNAYGELRRNWDGCLYERARALELRILKTLSLRDFKPSDLHKNEFDEALTRLKNMFATAIVSSVSPGDDKPDDTFLDYLDDFQRTLGWFKVENQKWSMEIDPAIAQLAEQVVAALNDARSAVDDKKCKTLIEAMEALTSEMEKKIDKASASALERTLNKWVATDPHKMMVLKHFRNVKPEEPINELNMRKLARQLKTVGFTFEETRKLSAEDVDKLALVKFSGGGNCSSTAPEVENLLSRLKDGSLPLREMTANRVILLKSILARKAHMEKPYGRGFDTLDALSVYHSLARNGLLTGRLEDPKMTKAAVETLAEVLSFLYSLNGSSTDNITVLGERLLGMDVLEFAARAANSQDEQAGQLMDNLRHGRFKEPLHNLTGPAEEALKFFNADSTPSEFFEKVDGVSARNLLVALRQLETNSSGAQPGKVVVADFKLGNIPVCLETKDGIFRAAFTVDGKYCPMACPFNVGTFADRLEKAIVSDVQRFGAETALAVLNDAVGEKDAKSLLRARDLALAVVRAQTGTSVAKLSYMGSEEVCGLAKRILEMAREGNVAKATLIREVENAVLADNLKMNSADVVELCSRMVAIDKAAKNVIVLPAEMKSGLRNKNPVREFAAELFQNAQSWREDVPGLDAKTRMLTLLKSRSDVLGDLSSNPDLLKEFASGTSEYRDESLKKAVQEILKSICAACGKAEGSPLAPDEIARALESENFNRDIPYLMKGVDEARRSCIEKLQGLFAKQFVGVFTKVAPSSAPIEMQTLKQLAGADSFNVDSGYGKFLKAAFEKYFTGLKDVDGRAFLASVFRQTDSNADPLAILTAMVKAAGPVFQKLVQGVPENTLPEELRPVVACSKSSLNSIPPEVVAAKLFNLVERSNGRIQSIEVKRSLGAASVGEALLCVIKTDDNPVGDECVVKMMRPDVQPRALREYAILSEIAGGVDETGSMKSAFDSRYEGILEEFDFTLEAANIELGRVYREVKDSFTGMSAHSLASPTSDLLILEKAEGTTFERLLGSYNKTIDAIVEKFKRPYFDKETNTLESIRYSNGTPLDAIAARQQLVEIYSDLLPRQKALVDFAECWTAEAIFDSGVFHGDLHGGNIMTSENRLTAIDFGNVSKLDKRRRECLMGIVAACSLNSPTLLVDKYKELLSPEGKTHIEKDGANWKKFEADLAAILKKGGSKDSALRLSAIIRRLEKYEFEIPAPLFNFSQSLTRLQDTLESVDVTLRRVHAIFSDISPHLPENDEQSKPNPFDKLVIMGKNKRGRVVESYDDYATLVSAPNKVFNQEVFEKNLLKQMNSEEDFKTLLGWLDKLYTSAGVKGEQKSIMSEAEFASAINTFNCATNRFENESAKMAFVKAISGSKHIFILRLQESIEKVEKNKDFSAPADYGERLKDVVINHADDVVASTPSLALTAVRRQFTGEAATDDRIADDLSAADELADNWIEDNQIPRIDAEQVKVAVREMLTLNDHEFTRNGAFEFFAKNWSTSPDKRLSLFKKIETNLKWLDRRLPQLGFPEGEGMYQKGIVDFAIYYMGVRNGIHTAFGTMSEKGYENLTDDDYNLLIKEATTMTEDKQNPLDGRVVDVLRKWRSEAGAFEKKK